MLSSIPTCNSTSQMKRIPAPVIGLAAAAITFAITLGANRHIVPTVARTTPTAPTGPGATSTRPAGRRVEPTAPLAAMLERARQFPRERLRFAAALGKFSTSELKAELERINDNLELRSDESAELIGLEWMDRDPIAAATWMMKERATYTVDSLTAWAAKDPDAFAREIIAKYPVSDRTDERVSLVLSRIGQQDPLKLVGILRFNDGKENPVLLGLDPKSPEMVRRLAAALPGQMQFAAPGQPDPPNMISSNQLLKNVALRYFMLDRAACKAWVDNLPEGGRKLIKGENLPESNKAHLLEDSIRQGGIIDATSLDELKESTGKLKESVRSLDLSN